MVFFITIRLFMSVYSYNKYCIGMYESILQKKTPLKFKGVIYVLYLAYLRRPEITLFLSKLSGQSS